MGTLKRGDFFGEKALLTNDKRMATVTAESPGVECLTLDGHSFKTLLGDLKELKGVVIQRATRESEIKKSGIYLLQKRPVSALYKVVIFGVFRKKN